MLKALQQQLPLHTSLFRHCAWCSRWSGHIDLYCERCWEKLFRERAPLAIHGSYNLPFPIYSLLQWNKESLQIGHLIRSLKGDWAEAVWSRLANRFSQEYCALRGPISQDVLLVPAPAALAGARDHAFLWAEQLSRVFNTPLYNGLTRLSLGEQKKKTRFERQKITMEDLQNVPFAASKSFIFVDDLITTGATAHAAWKALGRPLHFQVWTVACRPRQPCGEGSILL
ncbi:MAG: ComF family protein [Bdellovibrionales bacterium]